MTLAEASPPVSPYPEEKVKAVFAPLIQDLQKARYQFQVADSDCIQHHALRTVVGRRAIQVVERGALWSNRTAEVGQILVLTKALGTGAGATGSGSRRSRTPRPIATR